MLLILFNKRMIQLLLQIRLRFEKFSKSYIWRVAQSCPKAEKLTIRHLSIICMKYDPVTETLTSILIRDLQ